MAFPVVSIKPTSLLNGQHNGQLEPGILDSTPGQTGGATVVLVKPAARAWRALCAAAKADGHILKATSVADSYRIYSIQERIFRERYTATYLRGRPSKLWQGRRWYQKPGTAVAAVPGTSNHGWAQAVDVGEERDSDAGAESLDDPTLSWLLANEHLYGWSHEVQSEPWHLHYFAGDSIPNAVLAYEAGLDHPTEEDDMTPAQEKILKQAAADAKEAVRLARLAFWSLEGQDDALAGAGRTRGSHRQLMKDLAADLGAKVDAEPDAAGDVDVDELLAAVQALPAKMVDELKARL